jgi:putative DNA primase/helicase
MLRHNAHPVGEMDLLGRRLIVVSESREDRQLDEAKVKRLTGGDPINARYMHKNPVVFTPSHLPLLITNHLPKVSDDGPAIWSRLRVIPFDVFIREEEQDPGLADALQAEADAVLAWSLAGWIEYQKRRLDAPPAVAAATDSYQKDSDVIGRFIAEACHLSNQMKVTAGDLFDAWERWRKVDGCEPISKKALGLALARHGFMSKESNSKTWWHGLCIRNSESSG